MRRFWRWMSAPRVSVTDILAGVVLLAAAVVLGLVTKWPWPAVAAVLWGGWALVSFGAGFVRGFTRSVMYDVRQWRGRRDA